MKIGIPHHTHARVQGITGIRLFKLLGPDEVEASPYSPDWTLVETEAGWRSLQQQGSSVSIDDIKLPDVLGSGDVIRLREGSSLVSVLWRRGAKTNTLFATERCNSLCVMCSQPPRDIDDGWRVDEMRSVAALIDKDEKQLGITGGEPTLLGNGLTQVLETIRDELPDTQIHILTNGRTFKDREAADAWSEAGGANTTWAIPLYADVPQIHDEVVGADGAFDETLEGLYHLARNKASVEIRVVLHKMTIPRLRQLAAFIYRRMPFVNHVALMGLEPMGYAKTNRERLWIDPADYLAELSDAVFFLAHRNMTVSIYNMPLCLLPRNLWPFARQSISEWKNKFAPECSPCLLRDHCSGFFASAGDEWRSRNINAVGLEELNHALA